MTSTPGEALRLVGHADFSSASPTPEHFVPLLYLAGLAADVLLEGYAMGSLSMTAYTLGARCDVEPGASDAAPPPGVPPGDRTNL